MAKKQEKLRAKIIEILSEIEETRNCDVLLTTEIWKKFYKGFLKIREADGKTYIALDDLKKVAREDAVKRIRAKIQNEEKLYLPTDEKVAIRRKLNMDHWYEWAKSTGIHI